MKTKTFLIRWLTVTSMIIMLTSQVMLSQQVSVEDKNGNRSIRFWNGSLLNANTPIMFSAESKVSYLEDGEASSPNSTEGFNWLLKFSATNRFIKDVSFANPQVGYFVTELGIVYKTTNGGENWQLKMNLGFPYYWYGVDALSPDTLIISGFNNQGNIHSGLVRWSFTGANTWEEEIILRIPSGVGWLNSVHFFNPDTGIVVARNSGGVHLTTNGGKDTNSWAYTQITPAQEWFSGNIDAQASGNIYIAGLYLANSTDFGQSWNIRPHIDNVFDGGVDFLDDNNLFGWTGGGSISPTVAGWVHRTTNGGQTWSGRLNTFPYPIRAVKFFNETLGLAVGGDSYNNTGGGIYSTTDGGLTWNLDINTGAEMFSIETIRISNDSVDVWCGGAMGSASSYTGKLYKTRIYLPNIVPVELINFTASAQTGYVELNWATATELNNLGFEVQRSVGKSDFITIGFVEGNGTVTEKHSYSFIDKNAAGFLRYRLKQIDFDGSFEYSEVFEIEANNPKEFSLSQNYPNPFNPSTTIRFSIPEAGSVKIKLFDMLGQEVQTLIDETKEVGTHSINFYAKNLNSGVYLYKIESGSFIQTRKMTLLK